MDCERNDCEEWRMEERRVEGACSELQLLEMSARGIRVCESTVRGIILFSRREIILFFCERGLMKKEAGK